MGNFCIGLRTGDHWWRAFSPRSGPVENGPATGRATSHRRRPGAAVVFSALLIAFAAAGSAHAQNASGQPVINGYKVHGERLSVNLDGISDPNGGPFTNINILWYTVHPTTNVETFIGHREGTYGIGYWHELVRADVGKKIKVEVNFRDAAGNREYVESQTTDVIKAKPKLTIGVASLDEPASGRSTEDIRFTLDRASHRNIRMNVRLVKDPTAPNAGTIGLNEDVTGTVPGVIIFPAGTTEATWPINVHGGTDDNSDDDHPQEVFLVEVSNYHDRWVDVGTGRKDLFVNNDPAPEPTSAQTSTSGRTVLVTFSEDLRRSNALPDSLLNALTVTVDGSDVDLGVAQRQSDAVLAIGLRTGITITQGQTVTVSYRRPNTGATLEDDEYSKVKSFTNLSVTNTSTATATAADPLGVRLTDAPSQHDGATAFTFNLNFTDDVTISAEDMRDHALNVTGGTVTDAAMVDGNADKWSITVEPSGTDDVVISVPTSSSCSDDGALCTADRITLSTGAFTNVPYVSAVVPLTAEFSGVPDEHDGSSAFTFRLAFSEAIRNSYKKLRDEYLSASGGTVARARRVDGRSDLWEIEVNPSGSGTVTVTLASGGSCATAPCTEDRRALSETVTDTVAGPPGLSVADAEAEEGPGAKLRFAITLDRVAAGTVTVRAATSDGTALAGEDYRAKTSVTKSFAPGETRKVVSISVLDDAHDEDAETMTLTLSNPSGAHLADAEAVGTITNSDPMPKAWLARFGRAAADHVVDAVAGRWRADGPEETHLTLGGGRLFGTGGATPGGDKPGYANGLGAGGIGLGGTDSWIGGPSHDGYTGNLPGAGHATERGTAGRVPTHGAATGEPGGYGAVDGWRPGLRDVLLGTSFHYSGSRDNAGGFGEWAAWGRTAATHFGGVDGGTSLQGDVITGMIGIDGRRGRWLGGLLLSHSEGRGTYADPQAAGGDLSSTLTSLHPYARYEFSDRVSVWGVLGYGVGGLSLTPDGGRAVSTDLSSAMAAVGGRGVLAVGSVGARRFELAVRSDALTTRTASDTVAGLAGATGATSRVRVTLEGSGSMPFGAGELVPTLEAGLRYDAGDAENGTGFELGGGLGYAVGRMAVEVEARTLIAHNDANYDEWGFGASMVYRPAKNGRGFSMNLGSAWGATEGGVESLWTRQEAGVPHYARPAYGGQRLQAELGYGFAGGAAQRLWTPYVAARSGDGGRAVRTGLRLAAGTNAEAGLEVGRLEAAGGETDHAVELRWRMRW